MAVIFGRYRHDRTADATDLSEPATAFASEALTEERRWASPLLAIGARWSPRAPVDGQDPCISVVADLVVIADARLDNRAELLAELGAAATSSDTATILAAWRRWGEGCIARLRGDFAFVVWEEAVRRLTCVRDPMGVKPFYWYEHPGRSFVFASQLAGILAYDDVPRRLDHAAAADHLLVLHHDTTSTMFRGIARLPPGHLLTVDDGRSARTRRWWEPSAASGFERASPAGCAAALASALEQAVACRVGTTETVGAHLSGGLDSSAVTCLAAHEVRHSGRQLHALSFSEPPEGDIPASGRSVDGDFIDAVREFSDVAVHHRPFEPLPFGAQLATAAPGMMPPEYSTESAHRWAQQQGIDIMLSGWGGDEAASFNGRGYLADAVRHLRFREANTAIRGLRRRGVTGHPARLLWTHGLVPLIPDGAADAIGRRRGVAQLDRIDASVLSAETAEATAASERLRDLLRVEAGTANVQRSLLLHGHLARRIEAWSADASRYGIDYRYPLLDERVLELALGFPGRVFLHEGVSRWVFRESLAGRVPDAVRWRLNKQDSWTERKQRDPGRHIAPARAAADRMVRDGNDVGGCVDLGKLRRRSAAIPDGGYSRSATLNARVPMIAVTAAVQLAAFVEHNRIDVD